MKSEEWKNSTASPSFSTLHPSRLVRRWFLQQLAQPLQPPPQQPPAQQPPGQQPPSQPPPASAVSELVKAATDHYNQAQDALKRGDFAEYGRLIKLLEDDLAKLRAVTGQ